MAVLNVIVKTTPIMQVRILLPPQAFMMVEEEMEQISLYIYGLPVDPAIHDGKTPKWV